MLEFNKTNFASLAEAHAYEVQTETHKVTAGKARSYFMSLESASYADRWAELQAIRTNVADTFFSVADGIVGVIESDSYFGIDPSKKIGQANRDQLDKLVLVNFFTQAEVDGFLALSISTDKPYINKTQEEYDNSDIIEIALPENVNQHVIRFTIAQSLDKAEQVKICQRYGSEGDLTPWHDCTHRQVRFHQDTYSVFINACQHEVRELKIVSPVEITIVPPPQPESEVI